VRGTFWAHSDEVQAGVTRVDFLYGPGAFVLCISVLVQHLSEEVPWPPEEDYCLLLDVFGLVVCLLLIAFHFFPFLGLYSTLFFCPVSLILDSSIHMDYLFPELIQ